MTHACACVGYKLYLRERNFSLLGYIFLQYWHTRLNGNQYTGPLHPTIERRRDSRAERGLEAGDVEQLIKQQRNSFQTQQQPRTVLRIDRWPLQYGTATNLDNKKISWSGDPASIHCLNKRTISCHAETETDAIQSAVSYGILYTCCFLFPAGQPRLGSESRTKNTVHVARDTPIFFLNLGEARERCTIPLPVRSIPTPATCTHCGTTID